MNWLFRWFMQDKEHHQHIRVILGVDDRLAHILERFVSPPIQTQLTKIQRDIDKIKENQKIIMSNQAEFDAQIQAANDKLDALGTAVQAEADQVKAFIDSQPAGVDTSALDGVVARLGAAADSVNNIFTPPATEPAPEPEA